MARDSYPITSSTVEHQVHHPTFAQSHPILFHRLELEQQKTTTSHSRADYTFPEGGSRAWLVILGSFSIITGTFGLISSVGLFQSYWQAHQLSAYTSRDIGWIAAVNVFLNLFLGVQIGPLFDRYGPRWLILAGSVVYVAALVALAECKVYWHFMLVYGAGCGASSAFLTTTALAVVAHWFEVKRGMATGLTFLDVVASTGGVDCGLLDGGRELVCEGTVATEEEWGSSRFRVFSGREVLVGYWQGFSSQTAFNVIAILNAGSAFGRSFSGYLSDRWGRFNTIILTLLFSLIVTFALWLPFGNHLILFYIFAPLFGFGSGSIISMAPVCIGQLCKADEYGQFYGTSYSLVAFA
ncbi:hypothetical protein G7Y89_g2712 [Cudoniella acicularis]|uniref:Major facilitator superfamily (MFS) profile domain-containing protein n=1 Tax=Cudoniella acicularis TaxID=354080 RepID=A0A8H4W694_9HELO|nr:hypothetical protein G7Y89_g2712 [Cudoniella acicularis]